MALFQLFGLDEGAWEARLTIRDDAQGLLLGAREAGVGRWVLLQMAKERIGS